MKQAFPFSGNFKTSLKVLKTALKMSEHKLAVKSFSLNVTCSVFGQSNIHWETGYERLWAERILVRLIFFLVQPTMECHGAGWIGIANFRVRTGLGRLGLTGLAGRQEKEENKIPTGPRTMGAQPWLQQFIRKFYTTFMSIWKQPIYQSSMQFCSFLYLQKKMLFF